MMPHAPYKKFFSKPYNLALVVSPGLEEVAGQELAEQAHAIGLPISDIALESPGIVAFSAGRPLFSALNHRLRIPTRILWRLHARKCRDFPKLFAMSKQIPWTFFGDIKSIQVEVSTRSSRLSMKNRIAETLVDAIGKVMLSRSGEGSNVEADNKSEKIQHVAASQPADLKVHVRLWRDSCTISVDMGGDPLYKRGFKRKVLQAPLRETFAYSLLRLGFTAYKLSLEEPSELDKESPILWDPLTGAGVFLLEALCSRLSVLPREMACESWKLCELGKVPAGLAVQGYRADALSFSQLWGSDINPDAVEMAKENLAAVEKLGAQPAATNSRDAMDQSKVFVHDALLPLPEALLASNEGTPIFVFCNPPYDQRISLPQGFYKKFLKNMIACSRIKLVCLVVPKAKAKQFSSILSAIEGFSCSHISFHNGSIAVCAYFLLRR